MLNLHSKLVLIKTFFIEFKLKFLVWSFKIQNFVNFLYQNQDYNLLKRAKFSMSSKFFDVQNFENIKVC